MGHTLWESASPHVGCLAQQFPSFIDKNKLSWEAVPKKTPELQAHKCLKTDVLGAALETLISLLFWPLNSGGKDAFLINVPKTSVLFHSELGAQFPPCDHIRSPGLVIPPLPSLAPKARVL